MSSDLYRRWSADSQKLYFWLRAHVTPASRLDPATDGCARGFLSVTTTGEQLMAEAVGVSKNTLTKLIQELRDLQVCVVDNRRGYVLHLGEWLVERSRGDGLDLPLRYEAYYLDAVLEKELRQRGCSGSDKPVDKPREPG